METTAYSVNWTQRARRQMSSVYNYIREDSVKEADKVLDKISHVVDLIPQHPTRHAPDKYRRHNNGAYRAFEKYHCRVAYRVLAKEIRIVQVRHTSREPRYY
jgi:plasmid stabilization system protein ParE